MSWPTIKLLEVASLRNRPVTSFHGRNVYVSTGALVGDQVIETDEVSFSDRPSRANLRAVDGDVITARMADTNKQKIITKEHEQWIFSTGFAVLSPIKARLDTRYLFQFLRTKEFAAAKDRLATGATQKAITNGGFAEISIPLPPLPEQRRIADILEHVNRLRSHAEAALNSLDKLAQSAFQKHFGKNKDFPNVPFPEIVFYQEGPGVRNWQFRDQGIKLINVKNIVDGQLLTSNTSRYLSEVEALGKYKHFLLDAGDFVVASSGVTWGKIAEVRPDCLPLCLNTSMIRLRPKDARLDRHFLRYFVEFGSFRHQISRLITGSAQPNFGPSHLKQVIMPLPDPESQSAFSSIMSGIHRAAVVLQGQLSELTRLSSSLQFRAFRGEL